MLICLSTHIKHTEKDRAVYSPKLRPHATSTELMICWPSSRACSSSTAARLVTEIAGCKDAELNANQCQSVRNAFEKSKLI